MKRQVGNRGNLAVIILLVLILLSILSLGGYYIYSRNKDKKTAKDTSQNSQNITTESTSQNSDTKSQQQPAQQEMTTTVVTSLLSAGGTLKVTHPKSWEVVQGTQDQSGIQLRHSYIKSPSGLYLHIYEADGLGGACELGERKDSFTLTKRLETAIPKVVFSQYSYSDASMTPALRLEDFSSSYVSPDVAQMKEGQTLQDTCKLFIYPVVWRDNHQGDLFVGLTKTADYKVIANSVTYTDISNDPDMLKAVQSLSK